MFFTHVYQIPRRSYNAAIKYNNLMRARGNDLDEFAECFEQFHKKIGGLPIVVNGEIEAGKAFDVDVGLLYWLFDAS